jgi:CRP/FNR family nitrogen fixation transcriptional regulator
MTLPLEDALDRLGVAMRFRRDAVIYAQDDEVEFLYRVTSGVVRTTHFATDGRRQVGDFYYAGDLFGLEPGPDHQFAAEALTDCEVQVLRQASVRKFAGDAALDRAVLNATRRQLQRMQAHVLLLGRKGAREKVAAFLMAIARSQPNVAADLPMTRQDIADYLGLTIETVSRMLTRLQSEAIVEFPSQRRFRIKRLEALEELAA